MPCYCTIVIPIRDTWCLILIRDLIQTQCFKMHFLVKKGIIFLSKLFPLFFKTINSPARAMSAKNGSFWQQNIKTGKHSHSYNSVKTWYFDKVKSSWKLMISFCFFFHKKSELDCACGILALCFCPNGVLKKRAIFRSRTDFFLNYSGSISYIDVRSISWHISMEISKKIQSDPRGKNLNKGW